MASVTQPSGIRVDNVSVAFGGVQALRDASLTVAPGSISGLIGPNGSGKTTLVNVVTGHVQPGSGSVSVDGVDLLGMKPHDRVRHGVARTFQTPRIAPESSVLENMVVGAYANSRSRLVGAVLSTGRAREEELRAQQLAADLLADFGLDDASRGKAEDTPIVSLRLMEIARAMMTSPAYLLLDEPAAGSDDATKELLAQSIENVAAAGVGVLLIEHHFAFVSRLSEHIYVLNEGGVLTEGPPQAIAEDPRVIETYLGTAHHG